MNTCGSVFTAPFYSGDDITLNVQFYGSDNVTPKPMTGYTVGMTIKAALDDGYGNLTPDSQSLYEKDLSGNASGLFTFHIPGLTNAQSTFAPGQYFLDIKQWDSTAARTTVLTTMLPINQSVTLRASPSP